MGAYKRPRQHHEKGRRTGLAHALVDFMADSNVVDRHIRNLRVKLQNGWRRPRYIETVPGRGYRFVPMTVETAEAEGAAPS